MTVKINDIATKQSILDTEFHQYYFITLDEDFIDENDLYTLTNEQHVNVVIPFEKISDDETSYGLSPLMKYFNKDFSNILITHADNFNVIHQCEVYKNVLFIRLKPYTTQIALHIISKSYDATDNILFFKDEFLEDKNYKCKKITHSNHYHIYDDKEHKKINLYYQSNDKDRNPEAKPYPAFSKFDSNPVIYYRYAEEDDDSSTTYTWQSDTYEPTYGEFEFDIKGRGVTNRQNTQINAGYRYNQSSPQNAIHYTGIKDTTNSNPANRCTLIDTNFDGITTNSNVIEQFDLDDNDNLIFPKTASPLNAGFSHSSGLHSSNIGNLYHKTIKYYNDAIYVEEFDGNETKNMSQEWHDEDEDEE